MRPTHSPIRAAVEAYLARHPGERDALASLLFVIDGSGDPCHRAMPPGRITCSAVVIDRERRVLHVGHQASGKLLAPGHVEKGPTLLTAALRQVCEKTGIRPGDLCLTPQFLGDPIDVGIGIDDLGTSPAEGERAHRHFDFRFAFCLSGEQPPPLALQDDAVCGAQWLAFADVGSPALRAKLLAAEAQGLDGRPEPVSACVVLHDGHGRYLLHLRDQLDGIWQPGVFSLLGGQREVGDGSLEATLRRELAEETPGLEPVGLAPYVLEQATSVEGLTVPVQVFTALWSGDPDAVGLQEGVLLRWFAPEMLDRLRMSPGTADLIRRHATQHPPADGATGRVRPRRRAAVERHTEPLDVHLILLRQSEDGPQALLSRRAGNVYASGLWHVPSGHLDGPHEDIVTALVREAREETSVVIDPADVRVAVTVHHRSPGGECRTGFFFEVRRWKGTPRIAEPDLCDAMDWAPLDALPARMVAYCRAGLDAYAAGARFAVHFQRPGDTIAYDPGADRLRLVPTALGHATVRAAGPGDAEGITRLRSAYVLSEPLSEEWIRRCADELAPRLTPAGDARACVIDAPDGSLAACALGLVHPVLPAPSYPRGLAARLHVVATHPDFRRRGYARAVVSALLDRLHADHVTLFDLHASDEAAPLYRELGFEGSPALMRMTRREAPTFPNQAASAPRP
ncbi:GNAT family N-acetyltransferase [Streptomyces sp. NPDC017056]|uniref:GNAT family N-acetyltransferase n=1 Tax=Streptomyces sp. NPDC017056 TaxID=3364973 RepID=UPI00378FAA8C